MTLRLLLAVLALLVVATAADARDGIRAGGGASIAAAPAMPVGRHVTSGWTNRSGGEFWRVLVHGGDKLTIDYGVNSSSCGSVNVDMYAPDVTDYTLGDASSVASDGTSSKHRFVWVAPYTGKWTANFSECNTTSYEFTTRPKRFAGISVRGGKSVSAAKLLPLGRYAASGWANQSGGEFWRVAMRAGDRLVIDYSMVQSSCGSVNIDVFAPNVNDYTYSDASPVESSGTSSKSRFSWVAPKAGRWLVHFSECNTTAFTFLARAVRH